MCPGNPEVHALIYKFGKALSVVEFCCWEKWRLKMNSLFSSTNLGTLIQESKNQLGENSTYAKDDDAWCRDTKIGRSTQSTLPDHDEMAYFSGLAANPPTFIVVCVVNSSIIQIISSFEFFLPVMLFEKPVVSCRIFKSATLLAVTDFR